LLLLIYRPAIFDRLRTKKVVSSYAIDNESVLSPAIRTVMKKTVGFTTGLNPPRNSFAD
jgi:hypothetical protein